MEHVELIAWLGKSKTAARRTVSEHLKTMPINTKFVDKYMQALVQHHPTRSFPAVNVTFSVCSRPPYFTRSLFVEARTGGLVDCSWVKCISNLFGGYDDDKEKQVKTKVLAALRNEAFKSHAMQDVRYIFNKNNNDKSSSSSITKLIIIITKQAGKGIFPKEKEKSVSSARRYASDWWSTTAENLSQRSWTNFWNARVKR